MKYPRFDLADGNGVLVEDMHYQTGLIGHSVSAPHIILTPDGRLFIRKGYEWDFGSGPAIDTPGMVAASLAHDALYDLIKLNGLGRKAKRIADKEFRKLLKRYGVGFVRRWYCWAAVRVFGGMHL